MKITFFYVCTLAIYHIFRKVHSSLENHIPLYHFMIYVRYPVNETEISTHITSITTHYSNDMNLSLALPVCARRRCCTLPAVWCVTNITQMISATSQAEKTS